MRIFVVAVFVLGFLGQNSALLMAQGQECFPGLGAVIDQFRCKKSEIIKGFPQGSGNGGGQPVAPRSTPAPSNAPRPVLRPLPQSVLPREGQREGQRGGQPRVDAPVEQPRQVAPRQRRFVVYNNVDLYGGDYARSKKGKWFSKEKCVEVCRRESTCIAFTYNIKHGVCFLKDELPDYRKPFKGAVSGVLTNLRQPPRQSRNTGGFGNNGGGDRDYDEPREVRPANEITGLCGSGYKTYDRIDFRGKDLAGYKVDFSTCRRTCNSSRDCSGFSWIKTAAKKRCWLKYETRDWRRKSNVLSCVKQ